MNQIEGYWVTLSDVRLMDAVYSHSIGLWGRVIEISPHHWGSPIRVEFGNGRVEGFSKDGRRSPCDSNPDLFWDIPTIITKPRPKRKVRKKLWQNLYEHAELPGCFITGAVCGSEQKARSAKASYHKYVDTVGFEVEVEE